MRCREAVWCIVLVLMPIEAMQPSAISEEKPGPKDTIESQGVVTDARGAPMAGCRVWSVWSSFLSGSEIRWEALTDSQGRYSVPVPAAPSKPPGPSILTGLSVRDAQGRIGLRPPRDMTPVTIDPAAEKSRGYEFPEAQQYRGRLEDMAGHAIAKATVEPVYLTGMAFSKPLPSDQIHPLPPSLAKELSSETAEDGTFVLRGAPSKGSISVRIAAGEFGSLVASFGLKRPVTIRLDRAGSVSGSIVGPAPPETLGSIHMRLVPADLQPLQGYEGRDHQVYYLGPIVTPGDGTFRFAEVPPGKYQFLVETDDHLAHYLELPESLEVKPGQAVTGAAVPLKPAIKVQGKVVDAETGEGIKDIAIYTYQPDQSGRNTSRRAAKTDQQGAFIAYLRPGKTQVSLPDLPEGYLPISPKERGNLHEITQEATLPPIKLQRAVAAEGMVVDEAGKPVADAELLPYTDNFVSGRYAKTDAQGKFSLKGMKPKERFPLRVRTPTAVTDGPVMVDPATAIRVLLSPKYVFTIRGVIIDDTGQPVKDGSVYLHTHWKTGAGGIGFPMTTTKSDDQGRFEFPGLWPGDQYQVVVDAEGFERRETAEIRGEAGKVHDVEKMTVAGARGLVEGTVVDSSGKPMDAVRVFNTGDALQTLSTTTDCGGRFRLEGFRPGTVYVFADRPGYRLTGVRTKSGAAGVVVKLLSKSEPVPPWSGRNRQPSLAQQRALARTLLERLWAECDHNKVSGAVLAMNQIDTEEARKWSTEIRGRYDGDLRVLAAEKLADEDLDEALAFLGQDLRAGIGSLKKLAERYRTSDPAKALRCAEEVAVRARAMDQPYRATYLAEASALVMRLGQKEAGRQLAEEVAGMVAKLDTSSAAQAARRTLARAMATYDLQRAQALLEVKADVPDSSALSNQAEGLTGLAIAMGPIDFARAMQVIGKIESDYADRAKLCLSYRLAPTGLADALRVIDTMPTRRSYGELDDMKALALSWAAVAVAPHDKAMAHSLMERALACFALPADLDRSSRASSRRPRQAGLMVAQAARIGLPDMESAVYRALASRATSKGTWSPAEVVESNVILAALLAMADPQTARDVLVALEPQSESIGAGSSGAGRDVWLKAWLLADPKRGQQIFEQMLAQMKAKPQGARFFSLVEAAQLLAAPLEEKPKHLSLAIGYLNPEEER